MTTTYIVAAVLAAFLGTLYAIAHWLGRTWGPFATELAGVNEGEEPAKIDPYTGAHVCRRCLRVIQGRAAVILDEDGTSYECAGVCPEPVLVSKVGQRLKPFHTLPWLQTAEILPNDRTNDALFSEIGEMVI